MMRHCRSFLVPGLFVWLSLFLCLGARAQEYRGTLSGTVTDASGAVIPNATVSVKNDSTGAASDVGTSGSGVYTVPDLDPGTYTVTVTKAGFQTLVRNNIVISTGVRLGLNLTLQVGTTTQRVVVTAAPPVLITDTGSGGTVLNGQMVGTLPLLGSNVLSLINLTNGNSHVSAFPDHLSERPFDNGGMDGYSINGGPAGGNNNAFQLDGAPNNNNEGAGFVPPPEAVSEVNVMTNKYDAEYGNTGGAITSVVLKHGTNAYHGIAYWHFRTNHLNARLYQSAGQPEQTTNWEEPGFVLGGPVRIPGVYNGHDKTFFMVSYEHFLDVVPSSVSYTLPSIPNLSGNFCSGTPGNGGVGTVIYDPLSYDPSTGLRTTAFGGCPAGQTGSVIPANRIDPLMANLLADLPAPNVPGCAGGAVVAGCNPDFLMNQGHGDHYHAITVRIDHVINPHERFFVSYIDGNRLEYIDNPGAPNAAAQGVFPLTNTWRINHGASFNLTSILSPTFISTFSINWLRHNGLGVKNANGTPATTLGFSPAFTNLFGANNFPGISFFPSGPGGSPFINGVPSYATTSSITYTGLTNGGGAFTTLSDTWTAQEILEKVVANHSLKWGFIFTQLLQNNAVSNYIPQVAFSDVFTRQDPTVPGTTGSAIADALLGYPTYVTNPGGGPYTNPLSTSFADRYFSLFLQDDWRVTNRLTLNLGLRWDTQTAPHERYNRANIGFNPSLPSIGGGPNTVAGATNGIGGLYFGGLEFASPDNRSPYTNDFRNWGPRFGIAYLITKKLVLRGGWGRFYDYAGQYEFPPSVGFTAATSPVFADPSYFTPTLCANTPGCVVPSGNPDAGLSANGYASLFSAGLNPITGDSLGAQTGAGTAIQFMDPHFIPAHVDQYNLGFSYELPSQTVFHIEYNGSRGRNLIAGDAGSTNIGSNGKSINQLTAAEYVNQGTAPLSNLVPNPFAGRLPGTALNGPTVPEWQLLLPYPQYTDVIETDMPVGTSSYNSLQVRLTKHVTHGLTALVNYTWGKNLSRTLWLNPTDGVNNLVRTYANIDQPQLLNIVLSYEEPFFSNKGNRFLQEALGGWTIAGNAQFQSGSLIAPFQTGTQVLGVPAGVYSTGLNPEKVNAAFSGKHAPGQWFNPCTIDPPTDPNNTTGTTQLLNCGSGTAADAAWIIQPPFGLNQLNPFIGSMRFSRPPVASLSLFKAFTITERVKLELRGDAYNLTNTPWFGWGDNGASIDITPTDPSFGQISPNEGNDPRTIQISGSLVF